LAIEQHINSLKFHASVFAVVGNFRLIWLNVTTPSSSRHPTRMLPHVPARNAVYRSDLVCLSSQDRTLRMPATEVVTRALADKSDLRSTGQRLFFELR
jgi:hypothetical protein